MTRENATKKTMEEEVKKIIEAVKKDLKARFNGITVVSSASAPASGSDVDLYIRTPRGQDPSEVRRVAAAITEKYGDRFGIWVLPVIEPQSTPKTSYDIRVKSERMRPTSEYPKGGWLPKAEVWVYSGDSLTVTPVQPSGIEVLPTKQAADDRALQVARLWTREGLGREGSAGTSR